MSKDEVEAVKLVVWKMPDPPKVPLEEVPDK
jgi:hypothetical protein